MQENSKLYMTGAKLRQVMQDPDRKHRASISVRAGARFSGGVLPTAPAVLCQLYIYLYLYKNC